MDASSRFRKNMWTPAWASSASSLFCKAWTPLQDRILRRCRSVAQSHRATAKKEMLANFTPYRVICDHVRSAAFLIADGVVPGNAGRNYVARMIIRRAARFGSKIGLNDPFLAKVAQAVINYYGDFYPELKKAQPAILDNLTRKRSASHGGGWH
ncbi:MAG: alanine--tRNA ligase-related protein [Anaerolineales bacterium]